MSGERKEVMKNCPVCFTSPNYLVNFTVPLPLNFSYFNPSQTSLLLSPLLSLNLWLWHQTPGMFFPLSTEHGMWPLTRLNQKKYWNSASFDLILWLRFLTVCILCVLTIPCPFFPFTIFKVFYNILGSYSYHIFLEFL